MTTIMKWLEWSTCVYAQDKLLEQTTFLFLKNGDNAKLIEVIEYLMITESLFEPSFRVIK